MGPYEGLEVITCCRCSKACLIGFRRCMGLTTGWDGPQVRDSLECSIGIQTGHNEGSLHSSWLILKYAHVLEKNAM